MMAKPSDKDIRGVLIDFGTTVYSGRYFEQGPDGFEQWRAVFEREVFGNPVLLSQWLTGAKRAEEVAAAAGRALRLDAAEVLAAMAADCRAAPLNEAVLDFAAAQRERGRRTILVAASMDLFSSVLAPHHKLHERFDAVVNSADEGELAKEALWRRGFERVGDDVGFANSLLIEGNACNVELFGRRGGWAYRYQNERAFKRWLKEIGQA